MKRHALTLAFVLAFASSASAQYRTMIFPSKPGVCGDGESYISTGRDDEGRHTTFTQTSRGFNTNVGSRDHRDRDCLAGPVRVELQIEDGSVIDVDTYVGRPNQTVNTPAAEAVDYLLDLAETTTLGTVAKHAILPALLADGVDPSNRLLALARNTRVTREARKSAIFWVWQIGSPVAVNGLKSLVRDPDSDIAKQAVFGLSQLRNEESATVLIATARDNNVAREVRKQAIFWLGQAAGDKATQGLKDLMSDEDVELKKQAVFALSQMKSEQSVNALIDVVKNSKDREVRKSALFWLGQSNDPRVLALFEDILLKK